MHKPALMLAVVFFLVLPCSGFFARCASQSGSAPISPDTCGLCHDAHFKSYTASIHGKKYVPGSPATRHACESCHGSGKRHVDNAGGRQTVFHFSGNPDSATKSAKCLHCHRDAKAMAFWDIGLHRSGALSCDSCHAVHKGPGSFSAPVGYVRRPPQDKLLKAPVPDLCFECHKDVRSQTLRRSHHPIREGKVMCFDCHLPHGGFGPKMVNAPSVNELCYRCHAEKRGPFLADHPPVAENCVNCHMPHGSNHYALLVRKTPQLCQNCHDASRHPGQPYTSFETFRGPSPNNRMVARNCVMCHTNIHGSMGPASRGKPFLR